MRLSLFGTAIFSVIGFYLGQQYLERLMPNQAAVFALPHPDLDPDGRGDFLYHTLLAAEGSQVCMCWPYTACEQRAPPPEGAFKLEITSESGRNTTFNFLSFDQDPGHPTTVFDGANACIDVSKGEFISFHRSPYRQDRVTITLKASPSG